MFNFSRPTQYDYQAKKAFHLNARKALKRLAAALELPAGTFEIRSNAGGPAVSGEVTLHAETLYVQVSQFAFSAPGNGILIRSCKGRKDYVGGKNNVAPLNSLNEPEALAGIVRKAIAC